MEAWRIPGNHSTLVGAPQGCRGPFGARFGLTLLALGLFAASCGDKQTTITSDTTTTVESRSADAALEAPDPDPNPITTDTTDTTLDPADTEIEVRDEEESEELVDGVYCIGRPETAVERTDFENRSDWEPAPPGLIGELVTADATVAELGEWRLWPDSDLAILVEPIDDQLKIYVSTSRATGIASCSVASLNFRRPVAPVSCSIEPEAVGVTVFVSGVTEGVPIVYTVNGEFAAEMVARSVGNNGIAEQVMWQRIFAQLGESAEAIAQFDDMEPVYSSVFSVPWIEPGETATASIDVAMDGEALTIDCGESGTMGNPDLELECSVVMVDGLPVVNVRSVHGLFANVFRDGEQLTLLFGSEVDLVPERGVPLVYSAIATRSSGEDVTADCGTVQVDPDLPLANLLRAAKPVADAPFGPHIYWRVTPECTGCSPTPTTLYFLSGDTPIAPWNLPSGHPGLVGPSRAHEMLLDAIAAGADVEATVNERGHVVSYTIDGLGISSDCLILDTLPPELVPATPVPAANNYCGYVHEG